MHEEVQGIQRNRIMLGNCFKAKGRDLGNDTQTAKFCASTDRKAHIQKKRHGLSTKLFVFYPSVRVRYIGLFNN